MVRACVVSALYPVFVTGVGGRAPLRRSQKMVRRLNFCYLRGGETLEITVGGVIVLFAIFCLIQFLFNLAWKMVDIRLSVLGTQKQLDQVYTFVCRKLFNRKAGEAVENDKV